jgi:hypothetical protein
VRFRAPLQRLLLRKEEEAASQDIMVQGEFDLIFCYIAIVEACRLEGWFCDSLVVLPGQSVQKECRV